MPGGREGGIGERRQVQVLGEVLGQHLAAKDILQQPLVAGAKQDGVVAELFGFGAVGLEAKVDHKHRHRLLGQLHPQVAVPEAVLGFDELAVGVGPVAVGDHHVRVHHRAVGEGNARGDFFAALLADVDFGDFGVVADLAAQILKLFHKALHQCPGAAHGKVDAPGFFHEVNHGVDGGHREGVAAHQQRLEGEDLAQLVALEVAAAEAE